MFSRTLLVIAVLCLTSLHLTSQKFDFHFSHLGEKDGLKYSAYNSFVTKDSRGFIWISSLQGCYRFDGLHLKHYTIDPTGNSNENIQSTFFEDKSGNLWFTTENALHKYIRKTDHFESRQFGIDSFSTKNDYHAFHLNKRSGTLWFKADNRIWTYQLNTDSIIPHVTTNGIRFTVDTSQSGEVKKVYAFPWWNSKGFEIWEKVEGKKWKLSYQNQRLIGNINISKGIIENDSTLWLISDLGLIEFDIPNYETRKLHIPSEFKKLHLWGSVFLKKNLLLLSSYDKGLWAFDSKRKVFNNESIQSSFGESFLKVIRPTDLYLASDKQLWISVPSDGLQFSTSKLLPFHNPLVTEGSNLNVKTILEDHYNRIWVLTKNKGIFIFDLNGKLLHHIRAVNGYLDFSFAHLSIDHSGKIWLTNKDNISRNEAKNILDLNNWESTHCNDSNIISLYHNFPDQTILISNIGVFHILESQKKIKLSRVEFFKSYQKYEFDYFFRLLSRIKEKERHLLIFANQGLKWWLSSPLK